MDHSAFYVRTPGLRSRCGAGGIVVRVDAGAVLVGLVKEVEIGDDYYVLPKGGLNEGESIDDAARREIHEETGLSDLVHLVDFGTRSRVSFDRRYWQETHYALYYTQQIGGEILDKEHHYGFGWFELGELPDLFWADERQLLGDQRDTICNRARQHKESK